MVYGGVTKWRSKFVSIPAVWKSGGKLSLLVERDGAAQLLLVSTTPPLAAEYPKVDGTGGHSSMSLHNGAPEHGLLGILPRLRPLPRSRAMGRAFVRSVFRLQLAQRSIWPWSRDLHAQAPEPVIPHALPLPCKDASRSAAFIELLATSIQSSL